MNKFFVVALASLFVCSAVDAQILRADELESYAKEKYGEKWVEAATNLGTQLTLDKNNAAENGGYPPTQNGDIRSLFWLFSLMALQN